MAFVRKVAFVRELAEGNALRAPDEVGRRQAFGLFQSASTPRVGCQPVAT